MHRDLSLAEKIGQLFVIAATPDVVDLVRELHVGGVIWFAANSRDVARRNRELQGASRTPLLISADLEAGLGMRFTDTTFWPPAMAVAATGDAALAEAEGRLVAREAKALGINQIFAPVADVNSNPDNPVINTRSFGEEPETVGRFVAAFIRGMQSEGVLATAKHFPGHGDTRVDSHRSLPILDATREELAPTMAPFRAAIWAGAASVMPGHLSVPALDATPAPVRSDAHHDNPFGATAGEVPRNATLPATLSPAMLQGVLRGELGFRGLIVSDAFEMGGVSEHFDAGEAAVRGIEAGEDQIVMSPDVRAAIAAVTRAVESGRVSEARIDESLERVLAAKRRVAFDVARDEQLPLLIDSEETKQTASEIARRSLTLVRHDRGVLPLQRDRKVTLLAVSEVPEPLESLAHELRARLANAPRIVTLEGTAGDADGDAALAACNEAEVVLLAMAIRARSGAGTLAVPRVAARVIAQIAKPVIAVSFGSPYVLRELARANAAICAWGPQPVLQIAAARALFGETTFQGRLPITIPGVAQRGEGVMR